MMNTTPVNGVLIVGAEKPVSAHRKRSPAAGGLPVIRFTALNYGWLFTSALLVIFTHHYFNSRFTTFRHGFVALNLVSLVQIIGLPLGLLARYGLMAGLSWAVVVLCWLTEHGDGRIPLKGMTYSIPFFLLGIRVALSGKKHLHVLFLLPILAFYALSAAYGLLVMGPQAASGMESSEMADLMGSAGADIQDLIQYWPSLVFLAAAAISLYPFLSRTWRIAVAGMQIVLLAAVAFSSFSGPVLQIGCGLLILGSLMSRRLAQHKTALFLSAMVACGLFVAVRMVKTQGKVDRYATQSDRIETLISIFSAKSTSEDIWRALDYASNERLTLAKISIDGFLQVPLLGAGAYWYTPYASGHSFVFDTLAFYGLLGGVPMLLLIVLWIWWGLQNYRRNASDWIAISFVVATGCTFMVSFLNPYFLSGSPMDFLMFYLAGMVCVTHARQRIGVQDRSATRVLQRRSRRRQAGKLPIQP